MQQTGYNAEYAGGYTTYTVSDFKLAFTYDRKDGDGPLRATLTKHYHDFVLELHTDHVKLVHKLPNGDSADIPPVTAFDPRSAHGPIRVEFENVDHHVTVRLNDKVVFQTTAPAVPPECGGPAQSLPAAERAAVQGQPVGEHRGAAAIGDASHVSLWRDVYYTPEDTRSRSEITHARPTNPVKLGNDEYFVMGDNSAASSDARFWTQSVDSPKNTCTWNPAASPADSCSAAPSSSIGQRVSPGRGRRRAHPEFRRHAPHPMMIASIAS